MADVPLRGYKQMLYARAKRGHEYVDTYLFPIKSVCISSSHSAVASWWGEVEYSGSQWAIYYNVSTYSKDNYNNDIRREGGED
jgi:hypothetical protein